MLQKKEKINLLILTAVTTIIIMLPTLYGFLNAGNDTYTGLHIISPGDYPVYYSYIEQVKQGHLAFIDLFTHEGQKRLTTNPFWLTVGLFAKSFGLSPQTAFHFARAILIPIFVATLYIFISKIIKKPKERLLATIFIILAGGFGFWTTPLLEQSEVPIGQYTAPPDMWTAEANTFLMLTHSPHFILSGALLIIFILLWAKSLETKKTKYAAYAGILLLIWFWYHPFHAVTVSVLMIGYITLLAMQKHEDAWMAVKQASIIGLIASPAVFYYFLLINADWLTALRAYQNVNLTSNIWRMFLGYGFLIPLAIVGWIQLWKSKIQIPKSRNPEIPKLQMAKKLETHNDSFKNKHLINILLIWLPLHWLIIYLPVNFQRRTTQGLHIVTALFAWFGIAWIWKKYATPRFSKRVSSVRGKGYGEVYTKIPAYMLPGLLFFLFFGFSALGNWLTEFDIITKRMDHVYLKKDTIEAFTWIRNNAKNEDVILSDSFTSHFIPGFTGRRVYAGHGIETAYYYCCKKPLVDKLFSGKSTPAEINAFLKNNEITYILHTGETQTALKKHSLLNQVYTNPSNTIYSVAKTSL